MDSGIVLIIALIIIGFAITWSNQGQVKEVERRQSQFEKEKNKLAEHDNRSSNDVDMQSCLLYTSPSPRDLSTSRMPSSA